MLNLPLLKRQLLRTVKGPQKSLAAASKESWELCAAETEITLPALYFPEQLERITGTQEHTNLEAEMIRIRGGTQKHIATIAHRLTSVSLRSGTLYFGRNKLPIGKGPERIFAKGSTICIPSAAMASTYPGARYFGHWMTDDLALRLATQAIGNPVAIFSTPTAHQLEYSEILGVGVTSISSAEFGELVVLEDYSQNSYKRARYEELRRRAELQARAFTCQGHSGHGVMLLRGESGVSRILTNELDIADLLAKRGFVILDSSVLSASALNVAIQGARVVIGVEGSQLSHALYAMQKRGALIVLQPPFRFNNVFKGYADCIGLRYGFAVGEERPGGFHIAQNEILRLLDHVDQLVN